MSDQATAAKKAFGIRLRDMRKDADLTGQELSRRAGLHYSKISRIEHARQNPSENDIRAWATACGADAQITELIAAYRQVKQMWVEHKRELRAGLKHLSTQNRPLYEQTKLIRAYEPLTVPGFLQTRGYVQDSVEAVARFHGLPDDLPEAVESRMNRLNVLKSGTNRFSFVLEAAALYTPAGSTEAMHEQLDFLLTATSLPNVALGVIPLGSQRTIWPSEGFYIYDTMLVRSEHWTGLYRTNQPSEIATFLKIFEMLRQHAVYGAKARSLIEAANEYLQNGEHL